VSAASRRPARREGGFVAVELVLGLGLLVLPVALLVLTLPGWSERQVTARAIAREAGRRVARDGVCDREEAAGLGATMAENLGLSAGDVQVVLDCAPGAALVPGSDLEARVTVRMPAVQLPGVGGVGQWAWTARHREPVDRYAGAP
jgi:hypothetical protein